MNSLLLCTTALCLIISVFCQRFPAAYDNYNYANLYANAYPELRSKLQDNPNTNLLGKSFDDESDSTENNKNQMQQSCKNLISNKEFEDKLENLVTVISHVCSNAEQKLMYLLNTIHVRMNNGEDLTKILQSISTRGSNQDDKALAITTYLNNILGNHVMVTKELKGLLEKSTSTALKASNSHEQCQPIATNKLSSFFAGSLCKQSIYGSDFTTYADNAGGLLSLLGLNNLLGTITGLVGSLLGGLGLGQSTAQELPSDYSTLLSLHDRSNTHKKQRGREHPKMIHPEHDKENQRHKHGKNDANHKNRKSNHKNHERSSHNKHHSHKQNRHGQSKHQHEKQRN